MPMPLKPQDLVVALKLVLLKEGQRPSFSILGHELGMSASEVHAAVNRCLCARLLLPGHRPNRLALLEFITHGVKYVFYPERGELTRGIPTAYGAPPLNQEILGVELPPVWPDPEGTIRGETLHPLYPSVPKAAHNDPQLYELLTLVDCIRIGRARERKLAENYLKARLKP